MLVLYRDMSGNKKSENFHSIKTHQLTWQNPDGSFPIEGSVLAFKDDKGHVLPSVNLGVSTIITNDLSANTIEVNTLTAEQINAGNIVAKTITVGEGILNKAAVTSNGSDIIAANANIYVTGDQALTGSLQAEYITLPDPANLHHDTYLWANNNNLLWEDISSNVLNIAQAVKNQAVGTTINQASPTDVGSCAAAINSLLNYFSGLGIFINVASPSPPTINFNSPCSITFNIYQGPSTTPVLSYTYDGSTPIPLDTLCATLTSNLGGKATIAYSSTNIQVTMAPASGYQMSIADVHYAGEAKRFCAHLGIMNIATGNIFALPEVGNIFVSNNSNSPFPAPALTHEIPTVSQTLITIAPPSPPSPLTPPNALKYYGIYMDVSSGLTNLVDLLPSSSSPIIYPIVYTPSTNPSLKTVYVYSIDVYNQSLMYLSVAFTPEAVQIYPPAGYQNGYIINGVKTPASNDFLNGPLIPYAQSGLGYNNTYTFTIIPASDLTNICLRINVDDGTVITFTGPQPTTTYFGAPTPPNPLVNIPGPQPSYGSGGILQYSQPITLTKNILYTISMTYYNDKDTSCLFTLGFVQPTPTNIWTPAGPGQNFYACPALDPLVEQNLSQYCFIQYP